MPRPTPRTAIAALTVEVPRDGAPVRVLPAGRFRAEDGRPEGLPGWTLTREAAQRIAARRERLRSAMVIDYEHQTIATAANGQPAPAAGWLSRLEWRDPDPDHDAPAGAFGGLYAVDLAWTARASAMIQASEYRYLSPVFVYDLNTGHVTELLHVALTNTPAIDGLEDLAARAAARYAIDISTIDDEDHAMREQLIAALGLQAEATDESIVTAVQALRAAAARHPEELAAARRSAADPAQYVPISDARALQTRVSELSAALRAREVADLVDPALADGRLLPAQEGWARDLGAANLEALKGYLETAQPIAALRGTQTGGKAPAGEGAEGAPLDDTELAVCRHLGLAPDKFAAAKRAESAAVQ